MARPPTSGTRHGNGSKGSGRGGPAKGKGHVAERAAPFEPGNQAAVGPHDMSNSIRLNALKDELFRIGLDDPSSANRISAINSYIDRVEGKALIRQQIGGPDNGPIPFVMYGAREAATEEEWQQANPPPT